MTDHFPLSLLQAISDWQRGGDAKQNVRRGQALKDAAASLPEKYRRCGLCCFRQVALSKGGVWNLIGEDRLGEKISSWTVDIEVAKAFKGGVPPEGQGYRGVILNVYPSADNVIVNLRELYKEAEFVAALERHKGAITGYHDGAGRFGNDQNEVVLEVAAVTQQYIYSMGGHSSPFEELVAEAGRLIHGRPTTPEERDALMLKSEQLRAEAGPHWLNPEETQRVVAKLKPHAARLGEIKKQQETR